MEAAFPTQVDSRGSPVERLIQQHLEDEFAIATANLTAGDFSQAWHHWHSWAENPLGQGCELNGRHPRSHQVQPWRDRAEAHSCLGQTEPLGRQTLR